MVFLILLGYTLFLSLFAALFTAALHRRFKGLPRKLSFSLMLGLGLLLAPIPYEGDFTILILRLIAWVSRV